MSFKICRGTLGSLAILTAIRNASSRVSSFALASPTQKITGSVTVLTPGLAES